MSRLADGAVSFQVDGGPARGRLVRLDRTLAGILAGHQDYPARVRRLVGEAAVLAVALASGLKYDGVFVLQAQGDGPVRLLVADVASDGAVRAYAGFDPVRLGATTGETVPALVGRGHLAFTVDQGPDMERYQGVTALAGQSLSDCAHAYFRDSEQVPTAVVVGSDPGASRAAALLVQRMPAAPGEDPDEAADAWRRAALLAATVTAAELLDPGLVADALLFRLFHEDGVRLFPPRPLRFECRCSREKVAGTLAAFPPDEVTAMAEDGMVTVTCKFCGTDYVFPLDAVPPAAVPADTSPAGGA